MANSGTLNRRILGYIDEAEADKEVKEFLKWALGFELEQAWENNPQFRKEYERSIRVHRATSGAR